ncbi:MAG: MGH1-like glycoside hydrolase domain-containing protein [Syntrophomonadaceae bacterium]
MPAETDRLKENRSGKKNWYKWGPYLTERQWGTVREDYSSNGDAWNYTTHEQAQSRTYRWGEEAIGGISDEDQLLCFAFAFWNGKDPILKERLFGLSNTEGNHGEDVKEYYYYLDNTPSHSYMKMLYKYPQNAFPYEELVQRNRERTRNDPEFELVDTGIFNLNRYFDIFIEYAKADTEDILIKLTAHNRSANDAELYLLAQTWFRNTWAWGNFSYKPLLKSRIAGIIEAVHDRLGRYLLICEGTTRLLFCDNETDNKRLYYSENKSAFPKNSINEYVVNGKAEAVNSGLQGTKAAGYYHLVVPANSSSSIRLRLLKTDSSKINISDFFKDFDEIFNRRKGEADDFYRDLQDGIDNEDTKNIQRQAFSGMLWNKQFYYYDVRQWLNGDPGMPPPPEERWKGRNNNWFHLNGSDILSVPDNWEFPWFASWDQAFHAIVISLLDAGFAKKQVKLLSREWYMHPNGQFPAYEWNFSDVNPPVNAWAAWQVYNTDKKRNGGNGDTAFLESVFHKLLLSFTWWVNRKDQDGLNIFQGGFLGLDNIGIFDRSSQQLPEGGHLEEADATSWMAMFSLNLLRISLELAKVNPVYQDLATKFLEHFLFIAGAMTNIGGQGISLWDEEDEFFYDVLRTPNGAEKIKLRSMVGLIPLFAVEVIDPGIIKNSPKFGERMDWFLNYRPDLANLVSRWHIPGKGERRLFSLLRGHRMKCLLRRMLDEDEFLSEYGIRSLSRYYENNPYTFNTDGKTLSVHYVPGESDSPLFGGNSNWRGPIWFPVNFLIIESLQRFYHYYGDDFKVEYPTRSGNYFTLLEISEDLKRRLTKLFLRDQQGRRPFFGNNTTFQSDPNFKDYILFNEYFHGDNGTGLGASHQTGWTGLVAKLLQPKQ